MNHTAWSRAGCYYFGTFNPIHTGHLLIAQMAFNQFCQPHGIPAVTFVPAGQPPHRHTEADLASAADRLKMVQLATASNAHFRVSDIEQRVSGPTYTVDILEALHPEEIAAGRKIPFIIGADAFKTLPSWHRAERLLEIAGFIQAPRPACTLSETLTLDGQTIQPATFRLQMPEMEISATWLRAQIRSGTPLRYVLPEPARQYILDNHLYGAPSGAS